MDERTMIEKMRGKRLPDYYAGMHEGGYSPYEILTAARSTFYSEHEEEESDAPLNVHFQVEGIEQ